MYFVNDEHNLNFKRLVKKFNASKDPEYQTACYVVALPEIYSTMHGETGRYPFTWITKGKERYTKKVDQDGEYTLYDFEPELDEDGNEQYSEAFLTLSPSYRQMIGFAMNLYNSHYEFNLMEGLNTWEDTLMKVFYQALEIRKGQFVSGVTITINK